MMTAASEESLPSHAGQMPDRPGRLWARLALFWAPVVLLTAGVEFLLWHTGETWPLSKVTAEQASHGALFMREYLPQDQAAYKLQLLSEHQPRVMVLSSSRGMQIRAAMLGETERTFLNGGGIANTLGDFENFIDATPAEKLPKVILLAVDLWWFNEGWPGAARQLDPDGAYLWRAHLSAARKLMAQPSLMKSLLLMPSASEAGRIGISAARTGSGFRLDGSIQQTYPVPADPSQWKYEDREHPPVIDRVRQGILNFQESHAVSAPRLARFVAVLARCRAKGIQVAAFAPPVSTEVYRELQSNARQRDLLSSFRREIPAAFEAARMPFLDATDLASFGLDDRSMFDGFHAAETFHLHLLRKMLTAFPEMNAMLPGAGHAVDELLGSSKTNFWYTAIPSERSEHKP